MYEQFYGLREKPFALAPDTAFLFLGRHHRHALTMLEYALASGAGFAVITGEIGSGKTTLIRQLLKATDATLSVALITNIHPGVHRAYQASGSLLPWVAQALGIEPGVRAGAELYDAFVDHLVQAYASGKRTVLIVDEAQNLGSKALEELRVLSNINADKHLLLQTILVGQPELRDTLRRPNMRQFAQRIASDYHLGTLQADETREYVRHRLAVAGGSPDLIGPEAIDIVHFRSGGVPRLINMLCDTALVYGFAEQRPNVDAELMAQVVQDRLAGGLLPLVTGSVAAPAAAS